ncbi:hypothetical protein [Candidatus Protochlamydia sp. W-9]|nr:hypothetical protein [Candidatus Protochlamydia sp. W-9]
MWQYLPLHTDFGCSDNLHKCQEVHQTYFPPLRERKFKLIE